MRSTLFSILALTAATLVSAKIYPIEHLGVKRQDVQNSVPISQPAMSDKDGNVVSFDASNVYLAGQASGL